MKWFFGIVLPLEVVAAVLLGNVLGWPGLKDFGVELGALLGAYALFAQYMCDGGCR